jgi:nucleotide-binding universal stress UspA family protein
MSFRSLLLFLDQDPRCAERVRVAISLARSLDCHLVGLAPTGRVEFPSFEGSPLGIDSVTAAWGLLHRQADVAAERFKEACKLAQLGSFETVVVEEDKADALIRHAHCSDLSILGQADPESRHPALERDIVERVVLHSARPTLLLPCAGTFKSIGKRVLVAWDDSREASRAIADAMPLLRGADQVLLVCWNDPGQEGTEATGARLESVRRWLLWHGVKAQAHVETSSIGVADAMLSRAADFDADLLVMGAYGHARLTEWMLGGATRGLLKAMSLPVLMSH